MNTVAWVLQIVLAILYSLLGLLFSVGSGAGARRVEGRGRPPSSVPPALRQFIGVAELAAAFGLTVPPAVHVFPWLAPLAAAGLVLVMVGASIFHARKSEFPELGGTVVLGALAAVTLFLRWHVVPF